MSGTWILLVVVAAIAVTGLANRGNLQAPLVLVVIGALASFIPGLPQLELEPHVLLGVVLPPLLYSAALRFSVPTFKRNLSHILRLGIGTVLATAFAVAFFAEWLVPELTFGAALVLGAVVAPTDAVSAVAVGRRLGLPKRVIAILTGEGLVNDATALTLFTVAVSAVVGTQVLVDSPVVFFGYEVVGGVAAGLVLAVIVHWCVPTWIIRRSKPYWAWSFRSPRISWPRRSTRPEYSRSSRQACIWGIARPICR